MEQRTAPTMNISAFELSRRKGKREEMDNMSLEAPRHHHHPLCNFDRDATPSFNCRSASVCLPPSPLFGRSSCSVSVNENGRISNMNLTVKAVSKSAEERKVSNSSPGSSVKIVAIFGEGSVSPLKGTPWEEVLLHTAERLKWVDEEYDMLVLSDCLLESDDEIASSSQKVVVTSDILIVVSVTNERSVNWINRNCGKVPNVVCFDSSPTLGNKLGGFPVPTERNGTFFGKIFGVSASEETKETIEVARTISEAWARQNSDDIRFCVLVIINAYIRPVAALQNLRAKGFRTLSCMVQNCGPQILNCLLDPNCRKALQCLNKCSPVDQVCNYRCIASYESPSLEAFSLCVLQKNNCLELDAKIPEKPRVPPLVRFRGELLTHETAEDIFIGWLGNLDWSWRVVAGQNPAYDQFPCQYQLFYRGKAKGSFWYEPVFQVKTLDNELVWRRRKYRVKRGTTPATFHFSVLDNGVISNEFWTIVDVADDLSWGLFHYHGAARVAGQSYTGAVLVSPDGAYPSETEKGSLVSALSKCGIKEWELFNVDNCSCDGAPLGLPDGSRLHFQLDINSQRSSKQLS